MSQETIELFHWANAGMHTCDTCTTMPRYTLERPTRPHEHCDCNIFTEEKTGTIDIRNPRWEDMGYSEESRSTKTVIRNTTDQEKEYSVEFSSEDEVSVSVSISSSVGADIGGISAEISSEIESSISSTTGVEITETITLGPGEEAHVKEIKFEGNGLVIGDRYLVFKDNPLLDAHEVNLGIDQIGEGTYSFKGYEIEM